MEEACERPVSWRAQAATGRLQAFHLSEVRRRKSKEIQETLGIRAGDRMWLDASDCVTIW
jgi:hypothetical protein